jgi:hypothetical protein
VAQCASPCFSEPILFRTRTSWLFHVALFGSPLTKLFGLVCAFSNAVTRPQCSTTSDFWRCVTCATVLDKEILAMFKGYRKFVSQAG